MQRQIQAFQRLGIWLSEYSDCHTGVRTRILIPDARVYINARWVWWLTFNPSIWEVDMDPWNRLASYNTQIWFPQRYPASIWKVEMKEAHVNLRQPRACTHIQACIPFVMDTTLVYGKKNLKNWSSVKWVHVPPYTAPKSRLHEVIDMALFLGCLAPRSECESLPLVFHSAVSWCGFKDMHLKHGVIVEGRRDVLHSFQLWKNMPS